MPTPSLDVQTPTAGVLDEARFVDSTRQLHVQMQARGDAGGQCTRQRRRDRIQCRVASTPIDRTNPTEIAGGSTAADEPPQPQLLEHRLSHFPAHPLAYDLADDT